MRIVRTLWHAQPYPTTPRQRERGTDRVAAVAGETENHEEPDLAWIPSAVGAAGRTGTLGADALHSGEAWRMCLAALQEAGEFLHSDRMPRGNESDAAGYRHLMVLLALGVDEALRTSDPFEPTIRPGNVDNTLKWGIFGRTCRKTSRGGSAIALWRWTRPGRSPRITHLRPPACR